MHTPSKCVESSYRIKGSKFHGWLLPAPDRDAFERELESIRSEHPQATHHCYAWRLDGGDPDQPEEMAQDDGEPTGTAGVPILNQLRSFDLFLAGCVVVRYFGGTKLGKAGLIDAYGETARLAINAATLRRIQSVLAVEIQYDYSDQSLIDQWMHTFRLSDIQSDYGATVTRRLHCPADHIKRFRDQLVSNEWRLHTVREIGRTWQPVGTR